MHVPFIRKFADASDEHLRDPNYQNIWGARFVSTMSWEALIQHRCTVVLGEGKIGKTHEFKQLVDKLRDEGKFAFFVPLEQLHDFELIDTLTEEDEVDLERWRHSDQEAYFFLDAVDELRLRKGSFRAAIRKLRNEIGPHRHRARTFISCRPRDWNDEIDSVDLRRLVPPEVQAGQETEAPDGSTVFTSVVARNSAAPESTEEEDGEEKSAKVKTVYLLALSHSEIVEFATLYAPQHADELQTHFERHELWHLYQTPSAIIDALDQLAAEGRLGSLEEQLQFGIEKKLGEVAATRAASLSVAQAQEGAERIALALFLTKKRSLAHNAPENDPDGLDVAQVLHDWQPERQIELLGRSLFDPTGVGAFRFHHPSTQEYLAALRLKKLRRTGLATRDLFQLLFGEVQGEQVVIPSMEPVTAWMALWYDDVLKEVKARNPLLLFRQGLPAMTSVDLRAELLRRYVARYEGSEWRGVGIGHPELKRASSPELSPVVRELWRSAYGGHDTREILIELVWLTPLLDCLDLAFEAAFDEELPVDHRSYACRAVLRHGNSEQKSAIGNGASSGNWPSRLVRNIVPDLLPDALALDEFLELAQSQEEIRNSVHGLGYALCQAVKSERVTRADKSTIRNRLTEFVWDNRNDESRVYQAHSRYDHFADAVIAACHLTVPNEAEDASAWAWSLAVSFHFGERRESIIASEETKALREILKDNLLLREAYFWACFNLVGALEGPESAQKRSWHIDYVKTLNPFTDQDLPWLLRALADTNPPERRGVAFFRVLSFLHGRQAKELEQEVRSFIADRTDLTERLEAFLNPPPQEPDEFEQEHREWEKRHQAAEDERVANWQNWREEVLADPDFRLDEENRDNTLSNVYSFIQQNRDDSSSWGLWNGDIIARAFSDDFLTQLREELGRYWRNTPVQLWSEREPDRRSSLWNIWLIALMALKSEAETRDWAAHLSPAEAALAARISTLELNGFASFLPQLEEAHPSVVGDVISQEVAVQLADLMENESAPMLHDVVYHTSPGIQQAAARVVAQNLPEIRAGFKGGIKNTIEYAFKILAQSGDAGERSQAAGLIDAHLSSHGGRDASDDAFWLRLLARLDLRAMCERVLRLTEDLTEQASHEAALTIFAAVFGDRHDDARPDFEKLEELERIDLLHRLVTRAYEIVRPSDDAQHEGVFSPGERDHAETARGYLFNCLVATRTPRTLSVLHELAERSEFSHIPDRLRQLAFEVAAQVCEPNAMSLSAYRAFDQEQSYTPFDNASLFATMRNRLADFEHHLLEDELSTVDTLRLVDSETELRRFVGNWLSQNSRGAYSVNQEAVTAVENRTDIRLQATYDNSYATIELKLDDTRNRWTGHDLETALRDQLVRRYLSHDRCQVGCLLICMREVRRWQNPHTGVRMTLADTVSWLQSIADQIVLEQPNLRLCVSGIDYS